MKKLLLLLLLPLTLFGQKEVVVHMNTDQYPTETRWVLYTAEHISCGYFVYTR